MLILLNLPTSFYSRGLLLPLSFSSPRLFDAECDQFLLELRVQLGCDVAEALLLDHAAAADDVVVAVVDDDPVLVPVGARRILLEELLLYGIILLDSGPILDIGLRLSRNATRSISRWGNLHVGMDWLP